LLSRGGEKSKNGGENIVNRKFLLVVLTLAVVLLATPYIGMVSAGKGQEKLDFEFVLIGTYAGEPAEVLEAGITEHLWGLPFVNLAPLVVKIGGAPLNPVLLSYAGSMRLNFGENVNERGFETIKVTETISIWADEAHTVLRGTLELHVMGNLEQGQGKGAGDNFIGFGTGEFAGVKISGDTPGGPVVVGEFTVPGTDPPVVLPVYQLTRIGTVMGWP
jgi:hypothetical protein